MSWRQVLLYFLMFATLVIPLVQLSFGFHYIDKKELCPIQYDITLLMAIGGVFEILFFAIAFAFIHKLIPAKHKKEKVKTVAQTSAQGSNRASSILIGNSSQFSIFALGLFSVNRLHHRYTWSMCYYIFCFDTKGSISKYFNSSMD